MPLDFYTIIGYITLYDKETDSQETSRHYTDGDFSHRTISVFTSSPCKMNFVYTSHNGMNLRKSVGNPKSRFERIRTYLRSRNGSARKVEILRDVFGKTVGVGGNQVSHGWGTYVFNLGVKYGYFVLVRKNRTVYWTLGDISQADGSIG